MLLILQLGLYLDFGGDEERRDADKLQAFLFHVVLSEHESVEEVLCQVKRLSVKQISLTYLKRSKIVSRYMGIFCTNLTQSCPKNLRLQITDQIRLQHCFKGYCIIADPEICP